jgi:NAD(P)-dependent dehydrogenase (short-subunit alcohol dehydrogenase family)
MRSVLITGAGRGIGLAFSRQYAAAGWRVFATCRAPEGAAELRAIAETSPDQVSLYPLDVGDRGAIAALADELAHQPIDLLLNNAGIYGPRPQDLGDADDAAWAEVLDTNVMGPLRMAEAFTPHLDRGGRKLIVTLSSRMGSMGANESGGAYIYRSSKAAVNAVVKSLAIDLGPQGIVCICFHPGWVSSDMGGPGAPVTPEDSAAAMRRVIENLGADDNGRFLNYDGGAIPW